ncbi:MAG: radical SAM protein, partial [Candidatus Aenigmatarchaeota archaeon]
MENNGEGGAEPLAELIEKWLGNPIFRRVLGLFTKRSDGERRLGKILKRYAGEEVDLGLGDKVSYFLVSRILNSVVSKAGLEPGEAKENLKQGYWRKGLASVLEGIAWKGPQKPFTSYCPFLVVWNFTNACNLNCKHCYQNADRPTPDELTTEEALDAVDEMADAGLAYVAMSGGEPLMRDDFFDVVERIRERNMGFSLATNGTMLTKRRVEKLEENDCLYVQVSVDGRPKTHNELRGAHSFEKTMEGVKNAVESDVTVGLAMTVTEDNLEDVDWVIDKTEEVGADVFMHYNFIPTGRGEKMSKLDLNPQEREELLEKLARASENRDI